MQRITCRLAVGDARAGGRLKLFGPDAAGALSLVDPVAEADIYVPDAPVEWLDQLFLVGPWLDVTRYAGFLDAPFLRAPFLQELGYVVLDGGSFEYGVKTFGATTVDRQGNESSSVASAAVLVNSSPLRVSDCAISVAAGRVTLSFTDQEEV